MDIVSKHKSSKKPLNYKLWAGVGLLVAIVVYAATQFETDTMMVDRDSIIIGEAFKSDLQVLVRGNGVLVPRDKRWISSKVSGIVGSVAVKPGHQVEQGDLLLQLSNPQLERSLEEKNWELKALQAELRAKEQELASQLLAQKATLANAEFEFLSAQLKLNAQQQLIDQGRSSLSKLDYESSKLLVGQLQTIWDIEKQRFVRMESTIEARMLAEQAKVEQLQKSRQSMIEEIASLTIYASFNAVVQEVSLLVGTQVQTGDKLVKLAQTNELIAELTVAEAQTRDIKVGQLVTLTTRVKSKIQGSVARIAPAVVDGNVRLDVDITGELPKEARPDLSVQADIQVAHLNNVLQVRRPSYSQPYGKVNAYRIDADGRHARKILVEFGISSVNNIQIISGLDVGDKIIISDPGAWERFDTITIN